MPDELVSEMSTAAFFVTTERGVVTLFAMLIAVATVAVGCSDAEPVSEEEYGYWCGSLDYGEPLAREADTWGGAAYSIALTLEQAEALEPPEQLRDYHTALKDVIKSGLRVAESEPKSSRLEEGLIPADERVSQKMEALTVAYRDLPEHLQERLESTGCLVVA